MNSLSDQKKYFEEVRNSEVGTPFLELITTSPYYSRYVENIGYIDLIKDDFDENHWEHQFQYGECKYGLQVDKQSGKVVSWRYIKNETTCKYKPFYEGAW